MLVLIEAAIRCFTEIGELWNAQTWSQKLNRKLALYHWSEPTRVLPNRHSTFTEDPQVNFSFNAGYDPQSNGTAERSVDLIKALAARGLATAHLDPSYWTYATRYAAQSLICHSTSEETTVFTLWNHSSSTRAWT